MTKARDIADSELGSLTVDTDTLVVDETNNRVGIGTNSPSSALDVQGDVGVSGGVYLGGTGSANKLDDYEEGVTTVTMTAGSGTITLGNDALHYTKIGNLVHVNGQLSVDSISSPSGELTINLPFTCLSAFLGDSRSEGICIIDSSVSLNAGDFNIQVTEGTSTADIFRTNASIMVADATEIDSVCFIKISLTYKTS